MIKLNNKFALLFIGVFIFTSLISCTSDLSDSDLCTAEFRAYSITVLTPVGQPADSVNIDVFNQASGKKYPVCNTDIFNPENCNIGRESRYVIFHDAFDSISAEGEAIVVKGNKGNLSFRDSYIFRYDGCHIRYVSGPDTVYIQPN